MAGAVSMGEESSIIVMEQTWDGDKHTWHTQNLSKICSYYDIHWVPSQRQNFINSQVGSTYNSIILTIIV